MYQIMRDAYDPDSFRRALTAFMAKRNLKPKPWAESADVSPNSLYNFLHHSSESLSYQTLWKLARNQQVTISEMTGEQQYRDLTQIKVVGAVQAGVFKETMQYEPGEQETLSVPLEPPKGVRIFALDVVGPSMNQKYPDGAIVIVCSIFDYPAAIENGEHVIVERRNSDGLIEATCKEIEVNEDAEEAWLWPRSDHPLHQQPIRIGWPSDGPAENDDSIEITGIVIGHFTPRKRLFLAKR